MEKCVYIIINVEKVITKVLLLRRNFDRRSWTGKSANGRKKKKILIRSLIFLTKHIVRVIGCTENDNISWSGGQVWMNSGDARVSCWTDNWKSLSHISIRQDCPSQVWLLPPRPPSSFVRSFYVTICLSLSVDIYSPRSKNKVTNFW